jgi:hypothetical protein
MQSISFRASVAQVAVSSVAPKRTVAKATPVQASAGRREALSLAAASVLLVSSPAFAAAPTVALDYQIIDDRKAKANGFELIYEVRTTPSTPWINPSDPSLAARSVGGSVDGRGSPFHA